MATTSESEVKEPKPQLVSPTPTPSEPEMFAEELKMESRSSGLLPLLFIAVLVCVVGGVIYFFVQGANAKLTPAEATVSINHILGSQGASHIRFSTGVVKSSVNEKPMDPHYKLLAKLGVVTTKPQGWNTLVVSLTPGGEKLLSTINGVEKVKNSDGTTSYQVPLAERKLVNIGEITMLRPHLARVEYTWQWVPNRLGRDFDASGDAVKSFNSWDRATLIKDYGVDFYNASPARVRIVLMEGKDGNWVPYTE